MPQTDQAILRHLQHLQLTLLLLNQTIACNSEIPEVECIEWFEIPRREAECILVIEDEDGYLVATLQPQLAIDVATQLILHHCLSLLVGYKQLGVLYGELATPMVGSPGGVICIFEVYKSNDGGVFNFGTCVENFEDAVIG